MSLVFDEKGNTVDLKREVKTASDLTRDGVINPVRFHLDPGNYECRVIIGNLETGRGAVGGTSVVIAKE